MFLRNTTLNLAAFLLPLLCTSLAYAANVDPTTTLVGVASGSLNTAKTQLTITSTDVPDNTTILYGPLTQGNTVPQNQNLSLPYPYRGGLNESATSHTSDKYASGTVGITVAGIVIYGSGNGSTITNNGATWSYDANQTMINGEDIYGGHCSPVGGGQYHYHDIAFVTKNSWIGVSGFSGNSYRSADGHSKLMGWSADGYPIYGPYGYVTPTDSSSGVQLMVSGYTQTNTGANRPSSVTATATGAVNNSAFVTLPADPGSLGVNPGMRITVNNAGLATDTYYILNQQNVTYAGGGHPPYSGPANSVQLNTAVTIANGSSLKFEYLPGLFIEDNSFTNSGNLDLYNGRYCVTPEFPNGTYAYFMTQDSNGKGAYPYMIGPAYYGSKSVSTAATKLVFVQQPTNAGLSASITPSVTVQIQDADGNLTASTASVTLAIGSNPGGGTLSGTVTVAAVAGTATFSNLSIDKAGTGYTLGATSSTNTGVMIATSSAFNVAPVAGPATHFLVGAPASAVVGSACSVSVTAQDQFNNTATSYGGTVHFTSTDGGAALPADGTLTSGTGIFNATFSSAGQQTITATDTVTGSIAGTSGNITVSFPATHFTIGAPASAIAGAPFNVTVTALDQSNNTAPGYTGKIHFTKSDVGAGSVLPSDYTFAAGDNGIHTFTSGATLVTVGNQTVTATDTAAGSVKGTSGTIAVSPATASHFALIGPATSIAGTSLSFTVTALDPFNNTASGYTGTTHFNKSDAGAGSAVPSDYTFVAGDNGIHTFANGATFITAGNQTITATDTAVSSITGTSGAISVTAAVATHFGIGAPASANAGTAFTFTVTALDQFGNAGAAYTGTAGFSSSDAAAALPASSTGVGTFSAVLNTKGNQTITVTDTIANTINGTSIGILVTAAPTANGQSVTVAFITSVNITLTGADTNTPPLALSFNVTTNPAHGTLSGTAQNLTYTATPGYFGSDSFQFKSNNTKLDSNIATVSLIAGSIPVISLAPATLPGGNVGTAFKLTLTASGGTAPYTFAVSNGVLPQGMMLPPAGVLSGTPSVEGTFNFSVTALDSSTGIGPFNATATYSFGVDYVPVFPSAPSFTPNPAIVRQTESFSTATLPADSLLTWNFGDGTPASATSTHVYATAGIYTVSVMASNPRTESAAAATLSVTINPAVPLVGIGPDSDGDGFSDAFEIAAGSDPNNAASTPTGSAASTETILPLTISKASIKLNFTSIGADAISFTGTLAIPANFSPDGSKILFDIGGVAKSLTLNAKGRAKSGGDAMIINLRSRQGVVAAQTAKYTASFKKGAFAAVLANAGLTNTSTKAAQVTVVFTMIVNNSVLQKPQTMSYTEKLGKSGSAK